MWLNGAGAALEEFLSLKEIIGFGILGIVFLFLYLQFESELEFDDTTQRVTLGSTVIAEYRNIRQIEIIQDEDDQKFTVTLRLGETRRYDLFSTSSDADASLNAATIARAVGKAVKLVN